MKRWIATILSISLVIGMAAVFNACGKKPAAEADTTAAEAEESTLAEMKPDDEINIADEWQEILAGYEDMSFTEKTTNEHYQEEYDALTLPMAIDVEEEVAGTTVLQTTTNPAVRETTTQFMFTSPSHASTTAKDTAGKTTAPTASKTAATTAATTDEETLRDYATRVGGGVQDVPSADSSTPQATYLDKYVRDILNSGVYTARMDIKIEEDGEQLTVPVTVYSDKNNSEINCSVSAIASQANGTDYEDIPEFVKSIGKIRYIVKNKNSSNPKRYIALPTNYVELKEGDLAEFFGVEDTDGFEEAVFGENGFSMDKLREMVNRSLKYCGAKTTGGIVCETYETARSTTEEGEEVGPQQFNFYFTKTADYEGLVRVDVVDLDSETEVYRLVVRLYNEVTSPLAFTTIGKAISMDDLLKEFGGQNG